jgi:hypothetical protein
MRAVQMTKTNDSEMGAQMSKLYLNSRDSGQDGKTTRREFVKLLGIATLGLAVLPKDLFALAQYSDLDQWFYGVVRLMGAVFPCPEQVAELISLLQRTKVYYAPPAATFHAQYSAPYVFGKPGVDPVLVVCDNGFEITGFTYYDAQLPTRNISDLNHSEMTAVSSEREQERFNCVLTAHGERTQMEANDHAWYDAYAETISHYKDSPTAPRHYEPKDWTPIYRRRVSGHGKAHTGFQVIHKRETDPRGKPRTQFIVSSNI